MVTYEHVIQLSHIISIQSHLAQPYLFDNS